MYRRILVPLDGSDLAETALPVAERMATEEEAEIHLVHVLEALPDYALKSPQDDLAWEERASEAAAEYLEGQVSALEDRGAERVVATTLSGRVPDALREYGADHDVDLVVMTTHGEGGFKRWWLGSVADELVRSVHTPLLLLRPGSEDEGARAAQAGFRSVLVPLDGSSEAEAVLDHARHVGTAFGARLTLIQVVPAGLGIPRFRADPAASLRSGLTEEAREEAMGYLEEVADAVRSEESESPDVDVEVVGGDTAAEGILSRASRGVDLVALATHGRGGLTRMVVGSVADKVLRGGTTPLLVVRAPANE